MDTPQNTFDPMAWLSLHGTKESAKSKATSQPLKANSQPLSPSEELAKAKAVTRELIDRGANIAESYEDFVKLGFALASGLGSEGHDLYHTLCAHSTKYRMQDCERKWQECLSKVDGRTSIATFYHMARQAGVDINAVAREMKRKRYY